MIYITTTQQNFIAAELVIAAFSRSFTHSQVRHGPPKLISNFDENVHVFISPNEYLGEIIMTNYFSKNLKIIIFGSLPNNIIKFFNFNYCDWSLIKESAKAQPAAPNSKSESKAKILFTENANKFGSFDAPRSLERFDYSDEWNNMGYGAIRFDGDIWSLSQPVRAPKSNELSVVTVNEDPVISYCSVFDLDNSTCMWVNREVGCIDSFEWIMIENFISSWRSNELSCAPVISEIPWGHDSAVTMRLDCDENVESARPLMLSYKDWNVPFSLAITTVNISDVNNHGIIREVHQNRGAILSHTDTHAANWGGSYHSAYKEAITSARKIKSLIGVYPKYAVSPFHQSPDYALKALVDAGYSGCIGGIIKNNPEFLMARGGSCSGIRRPFIGHTQQVMLHGDCMLDSSDGDELSVFKSSFELGAKSGSIFGFLDHPFSKRYQYGWHSEVQRIKAHHKFINYIRSSRPSTLFMSESQVMDHLVTKDSINISYSTTEINFIFGRPRISSFDFKAIYKGVSYKISEFEGIRI